MVLVFEMMVYYPKKNADVPLAYTKNTEIKYAGIITTTDEKLRKM